MKTKLIVPMVLATLFIGAPVLAVDATPEQRCQSLEQQFDAAIVSKPNSDESDSARDMRDAGSILCESGDHDAGIAQLEQAMKKIGVKAM